MLFVLSGPSGVGKTTLGNSLLAKFSRLKLSVSHTTRAPRGREEDGVHYFFVSDEEFDELAKQDAFAEHADVFGQRYGTARKTLADFEARDHDVLLDIDYQGAEQLMNNAPDAVSVLLAPPSMRELEDRLRGRATDSEAQIERRLAKARLELSHYRVFRYVVVNDDIEAASERLEAIYCAERARISRNVGFLEGLIDPQGS